MKTRRFFSAFFAGLLCVLLTVPAMADTTVKTLDDPAVQARAALLVDRTSDTVLYSLNQDERLYPSSLVKITTALLVMEAVDAGRLSMDMELTASQSAIRATVGLHSGIKTGEILTVRELLCCMLMVSSNDAANILAEAVGGTIDAFIDMMNRRVQELGCTNTNFTNTTGEHDDRQYTSAWDLYLITKAALEYEEFLTICDSPYTLIPPTNLSGERALYTTNYLLSNWRALGYVFTDARGDKDASSTQAGYCLVSTAVKDDLDLVSVVLGAQRVILPGGKAQVQSFSETTRLIKWGCANFAYQTILTPNEMLASMPVTMSDLDSVALHSADDISVLMPKILRPEDLTRTIRFSAKSTEAPVAAGQQLAEAELSYDGKVYAVVPLVALNDVEASPSMLAERRIREFFGRIEVKIILILLAVLFLTVTAWLLTAGKRRYRYGRSSRSRSNYRGRRR